VTIDLLSSATGIPVTRILNVMEKFKRRGFVLERKDLGRGVYAIKDSLRWREAKDLLSSEEFSLFVERLTNFYEQKDKRDEETKIILAELYKYTSINLERLEIIKEVADLFNKGPNKLKAVEYYDCIIKYFEKKEPSTEKETELFLESIIAKTFTLMHRMAAQEQIDLLKKAKDIAEKNNLFEKLALISLRLARAYQDLGFYQESSKFIEKFIRFSKYIEDIKRIKLASHCLSEYYVWKGRFKEAISCYEKLIGNIEEFEDDENALMATQLIGFTHVLCGRVSRGLGMIEAVMNKARSLGYEQVVNYCHQAFAISFLTLQKIEEAKPHVEVLLSFPEEVLGDILYWAVLIHKAYILCLEGDLESSFSLLKKAMEFQFKKNRIFTPYPWLFETVRILESKGFWDQDINLERMIQRFMELDDVYIRGVVLRYRGLKFLENGDERALGCLLSSERYLRYAGAEVELAKTRLWLGKYYLVKNEVKKSKPYLEKAWEVFSTVKSSLFPPELISLVSPQQHAQAIINRIIKLTENLGSGKDALSFLEEVLNTAMDITLAMRGSILRNIQEDLAIIVSRNVDPETFLTGGFKTYLMEAILKGAEVVKGAKESEKGPFLIIPIKISGKSWGCLYLEGRIDNEDFSPDIVPFVKMLCVQAALVLNALTLQEEFEKQQEILSPEFPEDEISIIGESPAIKRVIEQIKQVAPTDATVLILGETGVGKELVARTIHAKSTRRNGPFIAVNLAAIPQELIASELFGHERGAFTGAYERQKGLLELADGGTVFFDEIGDLPLAIQVKLLRVLEEGVFTRLGSAKPIKSDFRIIAATNKNLEEEVKKGTFRQDLFYRLNVFPIYIPPLRERKEDIIPLAFYFLKKFSEKYGKKIRNISNSELSKLLNYHWPGNVRELKHVIERAVISSSGSTINFVFDISLNKTQAESKEVVKTLAEIEKEHIEKVLSLTGWRVSGPKGAANLLGVKPSTLRFRMKKLGITRPCV